MKQKPTTEPENLEELTVDDVEVAPEAVETNPETAAPEPDHSAEQLVELTNDLQRTRADFENFRKQVDLQKSQAMAAARYATVEKFLPLLDDLSRAIATYPEQLAPLEKNLAKLLQSLGLALIDSQPGTEFNPDFHEAVSVEDEGGDIEVVSETLRPGYLYDGSVLRAAMVKVRKCAPEK